jgi:hypothetical protein
MSADVFNSHTGHDFRRKKKEGTSNGEWNFGETTFSF